MSSHKTRNRARESGEDSELILRESLRRASLRLMLSEEAPPESGSKKSDPPAEESTLSDDEIDALGSDLEKMYAKSQAKLTNLTASFKKALPGPAMKETVALMQIASKTLSKKMVDTENPESVQLFAAAETFMSSFASLMIAIRKATKSMKDDSGKPLEGSTTLDTAYGGEEDLKDLISTKFVPSAGFRQKMADKMKPFAEYFKDMAGTGQAKESFDRYDDMLLEVDLFEFTDFEPLYGEALNEVGFFQSLKKLFGDGKFTFKGFFQGLFRQDMKDAKSSVKSMLPLFGGKNIAAALLKDLAPLEIDQIKKLLDSNVAFYKEAISSGGSSAGGGGAGSGASGAGGSSGGSGSAGTGGGSGSSAGAGGSGSPPPAPTPEQTQAVRNAPTEVKNDSKGALEKIFSPEVAAKFMDVASGKTKVDSLESPEKEIISAFIANISKTISKGETPDTELAATATRKRITGIDDDKKGEITGLVGDKGFESLIDKLLAADPKVQSELGLAVESRRRTTLESALSRKSMMFLFEADESDIPEKVIKPAIEPHLNDDNKGKAGEIAKKVYDILKGKKDSVAPETESGDKGGKDDSGGAPSGGGGTGGAGVGGSGDGKTDEEKKYKIGQVVEIDGEKKISLGLGESDLSDEKKKEVLDKIKSSLKRGIGFKWKTAGHPDPDVERGEMAAKVSPSIKEILGFDKNEESGPDYTQDQQGKIADKLVETRESSESLIIERWQRLAGLVK